MTTYPAIIARPDTWCVVCGDGWTPQSVAVRFAPLQPMVCGECVEKAARLVREEKARRLDDEKARRGEP